MATSVNPTCDPSTDLVPAGENAPSSLRSQLPEILSRAGQATVFAAEEFFFGRTRNEQTRAAYLIAVKRFLARTDGRGLELIRIAPKDVGLYLDGLRNENTSVATRKQHLASIRHFFDGKVNRHAIILNPALSVGGERYEVVEGKTPKMTVQGARKLLASLKTASVSVSAIAQSSSRNGEEHEKSPARGPVLGDLHPKRGDRFSAISTSTSAVLDFS